MIPGSAVALTASLETFSAKPRLCVSMCERFEGFRPSPYLCPALVPTIGYGTTRYPDGHAVTLTDLPVTREMAEELLLAELDKCGAAVLRLCPRIDKEPEGRLAALADFTYNLGPGRLKASTLRECVNDGKWAQAEAEFGKWVWAGGRRLAGLVARRAVEAAVFSGRSVEAAGTR